MKLTPSRNEMRFYGFNAYTATTGISIAEFLNKWHVALREDLYWCGFKTQDRIAAETDPRVDILTFPKETPEELIYIGTSPESQAFVQNLGRQVAEYLKTNGRTPLGQLAYAKELAHFFPSDGRTIAALACALHTGQVTEVQKPLCQPRYVATGTVLEKILRQAS